MVARLKRAAQQVANDRNKRQENALDEALVGGFPASDHRATDAA
jgi:hypothetical protein